MIEFWNLVEELEVNTLDSEDDEFDVVINSHGEIDCD